MQEIKEELSKVLRGDVEDSKKTLERYSKDYSIFSIKPELVVFPKDSKDVENLVKYINKKKGAGYVYLSLTPRGAGSDMTGGPLTDSIVVDMSRYMQGVLEIKSGKFGRQSHISGHTFEVAGIAKVLPGTFYRDFEKETLKEGLIMPCYPASREIATVGGMVANNGAGEKSLKYGQNKDFVKELKVVLEDGIEYEIKPINKQELEAISLTGNAQGELYRKTWALIKRNEEIIRASKPKVSKNSSGYLIWDVWNEATQMFDPTKLFIGAQGTTGIITEITYKLVEAEKYSTLLVAFLKDLKQIPELTKNLMQNDLETLEIYDDNTLKFAVKFFRNFVKEKGIFGTIKYAIQFLPEFFMVLFGGMPKLVVLAEFTSNDKEGTVREAMLARDRINVLHLKTRITKTDSEREKYFAIRRDSFKLLSDHSKSLRTAPFIDDVIVPVENLPKYIPELISLLDGEKILYTVAGHLGNGNLHVIPLMDFKDPKTFEKIEGLSKTVYEMVKKYGGSITAEHNDGLIRTPYLKMMFGEKMVEVFREIKEIADPKKLFNPKKKTGVSLEESMSFVGNPNKK